MSNSLIVKQRVEMKEEYNSMTEIAKAIKKRNYNTRRKQKAQQLFSIVLIPRQITEHIYIKSSVELMLALSCYPENWLGQLRENPCTYNYRVSRTDKLGDMLFYTLEQQDKFNYDIDSILNLLDKIQDPHSQIAKKCVLGRQKILQNFESQHLISNEELHEAEQMARQYPYQCTISKVNKDSTILSQRIVNQQYMTLIGINDDMMYQHLKETKTVPSIFILGQSLKNWCDLSIDSITGIREFETTINTYEGQQYKCIVEQRQMFKRTMVNLSQIVFIEYWIFKIDDRLKSLLMNQERVYRNSLDYFNKKHTIEEHKEFMNKLQPRQGIQYSNPKPCGYLQIG